MGYMIWTITSKIAVKKKNKKHYVDNYLYYYVFNSEFHRFIQGAIFNQVRKRDIIQPLGEWISNTSYIIGKTCN